MKTITINYEIYLGSHTEHGEAYGFATRAAAKAYVTRVFNATYGRGNWLHARPPRFYVE